MRLAALDATDRNVAIAGMAIGTLLLSGLVISGMWPILVYSPGLDDIQVIGGGAGLVNEPLTATSIHATFADLSALFVLLATAWVSYRVLANVSWTGLLCFIIVAVTIVGGGALTVNTVVMRDDAAAPVSGDALQSAYEIVRIPEPVSTVLHVASLPAMLVLIWFAVRRRRSAANAPGAPSWLDLLGK